MVNHHRLTDLHGNRVVSVCDARVVVPLVGRVVVFMVADADHVWDAARQRLVLPKPVLPIGTCECKTGSGDHVNQSSTINAPQVTQQTMAFWERPRRPKRRGLGWRSRVAR